eukprot:5833165-Pleurochrysis_carterae.AAC.4
MLNQGWLGGVSKRSRRRPKDDPYLPTLKSKVGAVKIFGVVQNTPRASSVRTFSDTQVDSQPTIHGQCEAAEGTKEPTILRAEHEL